MLEKSNWVAKRKRTMLANKIFSSKEPKKKTKTKPWEQDGGKVNVRERRMDKAMEQMKANKNVLPSGIYGSTAPNQFNKIGPNAKKEIVKIVNSVNQTQMNDKF